MTATWTGIILCVFVLYFGVVHSTSNPSILLNPHALILVVGGTIAIAFLTYSGARLLQTLDYILYGFLFRIKSKETQIAKDLLFHIDEYFNKPAIFELSNKPHPFIIESFSLLKRSDISYPILEQTLMDRRSSIKRRYIEDAKILNNLAKYPPHLGLMGAASGMIEMMTNLGKAGIETIGGSLAIALSATLWGVGMNNFIFLPLADNSQKAAEDEIYLRDIIIQVTLMIKKNHSYEEVVNACLNKLDLFDRVMASLDYKYQLRASRKPNAA